MFGKLLDTASLLKAKLAKDELDQALIQATNEDNWQASTTILHEISSSAYNHQKWKKINDFIWEKLKNTKRWKKILKALNIVEFLLKNGPEFAVNQLKRDLDFFRTMQSFQAFEDGMDRGASIRERGRIIVSLLQNEEQLEDERVLAKQIRERMSHLAGNTSYNSQTPHQVSSFSNKYQSYNSNAYSNSNSNSNSEDNKAFYNYGNGNYGDRQENKHHRDDYFHQASRKIEQPTKQQSNSIKKVESQEPRKSRHIQPIVNINLKSKRVEEKISYQTIAQRLMKPKQSIAAPVVPDLSYKKKDLLTDTEAYFVEHKYHFQEQVQPTAQKSNNNNAQYFQPEPIKSNVNQQYIPPAEIVTNQFVANPVPPTTQAVPNLLTQLDGLLFLGIEPQSTTNLTPNINKPGNSSSNFIPQQTTQNQNILSAPVVQPATNNFSIPQPLASQSLQHSNMINSYPSNYNSYPNYNGYSNPQQSYYNPYSPNQNAYQSNSAVTNMYAQNPIYNTQYHQPQLPQYNYQPSSYQPNNAYTSPFTSPPSYFGNTNPSPSPKPVQNTYNNVKQKQDEFGDFKNGGSFDIEKINWMSNKEKNLTDLTDFTFVPKDTSKKQKKIQFTNNLKIDPWAW